MNARQKAKYYKRKYEELDVKFSPKFITTTNYKVDTLRFQRIYPEALIVRGREDILVDVITKEINYEDLQDNKRPSVVSY